MEKEKQQAFENLLLFKEVLDLYEVKFLLDGGTLLGAYRDKDCCEDDHNDIDLTTLDDGEMLMEILEEAGKRGFELYHYWGRNDVAPNTTMQIGMLKDGLKIDLMFKELKKCSGCKKCKRAWWTVYGGPNKVTYKSVQDGYYLETKEIDFKGTKFLIPKNVEDYLELRYGNWKTPVHRRDFSCFTSDKVIRESYAKI